MTTEVGSQVDVSALPLRDVAQQARRELETLKLQVEGDNGILPRAQRNIQLIDQIRKSPSIKSVLTASGGVVGIISPGFSAWGLGLYVSAEGYEMYTSTISRDEPEPHVRKFPELDSGIIDSLYKGKHMDYGSLDRRLVANIAKLKPDQIFDKFRRALDRPIRTK